MGEALLPGVLGSLMSLKQEPLERQDELGA